MGSSTVAKLLATAAIPLAIPAGALAQTGAAHHRSAHAGRSSACGRQHKRGCSSSHHKTSRFRARSSAVPTPHVSARPALSPAAPGSTSTTSSSAAPSIPPITPTIAPVLTITGTTYYVSPAGSDSNSGRSPNAPWRTVKRVNEASLRPGDGVLFQGGATFSDDTLMPQVSGTAGSPIVFGSYGQGNATLPEGIWFRGESFLAFEHLTVTGAGNLQGTGSNVTVEYCSIGNDSLPIDAMGSNWTIDDNTVENAGNSGMLLEGENFTVSGNTIANTGLDTSITYGKHGIYLKVSNATVTGNTITNFSDDGISVRYRNSVLRGNHISDGPIGIAWFQVDATGGTSYWTDNAISATSDAGIYVSGENSAQNGGSGSTRESFVIERNLIAPSGGRHMNLEATSGSYATSENSLV